MPHHTLHEELKIIPNDSRENLISGYIREIANCTGWESGTAANNTANYIYLNNEKTDYIYFANDSTNNVKVNYKINNITFNTNSFAYNGSGKNYLRIHRSTDETVTYVSIAGEYANTFIYAINENNEALFIKGLSNTSTNIYANSSATNYSLPTPSTNATKRCSLARYIDSYNTKGGFFSELYWIHGLNFTPPVDDCLVQFEEENNSKIMRLVSLYRSAATMYFAFPVSNPPSEPEQNESTP